MADLEFIWDPKKARSNLRKHGVSFEEAATVFFDESAIEFFDDTHSEEESFFALGTQRQFQTSADLSLL